MEHNKQTPGKASAKASTPAVIPNVNGATPEVTPEETGGDGNVTMSPPPIPPGVGVAIAEEAPKTIAVRAIDDHECQIGGTQYNFKKNVRYTLPISDAVILSGAGKVIMAL